MILPNLLTLHHSHFLSSFLPFFQFLQWHIFHLVYSHELDPPLQFNKQKNHCSSGVWVTIENNQISKYPFYWYFLVLCILVTTNQGNTWCLSFGRLAYFTKLNGVQVTFILLQKKGSFLFFFFFWLNPVATCKCEAIDPDTSWWTSIYIDSIELL